MTLDQSLWLEVFTKFFSKFSPIDCLGLCLVGSCPAFIHGRQILDGILIANAIVEDVKHLEKDLLLFKVDFEKAFNSIDWSYLAAIMKKMNFPTLWRKWIMECVSTATTSILVNGSPTDEFKFEQGLRQGDPFHLFYF